MQQLTFLPVFAGKENNTQILGGFRDMETMRLQVYLAAFTLVLSGLILPIIHTQVQSDMCPANCKERNCFDPSENFFFCTFGCIDESFYGSRCLTPCPSTCLTCYRYYKKKWECYGCKDGYYSTALEKNCTMKCPIGCSACKSNTNCTNCEPGYYLDVSSSVCSSCPLTCKACYSDTNCTECSTNYDGDTCNKCIDGKHGDNCAQDCPLGCSVCSSVQVCTACARGYYLTEQSSTCQQCPPSCDECSSDTNCSDCTSGFKGRSCQHCIDGKYDENCDLDCPDECQTCISKDVCEVCKPGFFNGINSGENITDCNNTISPCTDHSNCSTCKTGYFNSDTNRTCSFKCPSYCDACVTDTKCTLCRENFTGDMCNICDEGSYGEFCNKSCPSKCSACTSATNCTRCRDGFYNSPFSVDNKTLYNDCQLTCSPNCHDSVCNQNDGKCSPCKSGYYGLNCEKVCPPNCKAVACEQVHGNCLGGCKQEFSGDRCCIHGNFCQTCTSDNVCGVCDNGTFGASCDINCSNACDERGCDKDTGICLGCRDHYFGSLCKIPCPTGCLTAARGKSRCIKETGLCSAGCVNGYHGDSCDKECNTMCVNNTCDKDGAACSLGCVNGFTGSTCLDEEKDENVSSATIGIVLGSFTGIVFVILVVLLALRYKRLHTVAIEQVVQQPEQTTTDYDALNMSCSTVQNDLTDYTEIELAQSSTAPPESSYYNLDPSTEYETMRQDM